MVKIRILAIILLSVILTGCNITEVEDDIPKPTVSITFDDGRIGVSEYALPIMKSYEITGTAYINSYTIWYTDDGWMKQVSVNPNIQKLIDNNWEIGSHSLEHLDMTTLSIEELRFDLTESKRILDESFGIDVKTFASPYGIYNDTTITEIKKIYDSHANAWGLKRGVNNKNNIDPYNIHRLDVTSWISVDEICDKVLQLQDNEWFVIIFHDIVETPSGDWDTTVDKFSRIVGCIDNADVEVKNISETLDNI